MKTVSGNVNLKRALIVGALLAVTVLYLTACANCDYDFQSRSVEYSNDAEHRIIKETVSTLKKKDFTQGWSNGTGKTIDIHPEASIIGAP